MPTRSPSAEPSDAFLLERVGRGHVHAYELIYNRYRHPAHVLAYRLCGRHCIAEEVVQEALLAVWRSASTFTESRGSASAWVFTIVRNRALDACRRHGRIERRETILDGLEEQFPSSVLTDMEAQRREQRQAVHCAIRRLPPAQREAVVLSHFHGLTNNEAAAALAHPIGTVKGRIRLGHARLRRDLVGIAAAPL